MRIAVTYANEEIFQHFGHTEQFKVYDVENGAIVASQVIDTNGNGHGALAGVLSALNADVVVKAFLDGKLDYNPNVQCNHHDHHHGEDHVCSDHGCGSHNCGDHHCHD